LGLESVGSPSLSNYGRAGIEPFRNHVGTPAGPHEPGINNGDGGIRGGFRGVLRARIQCAITLVPPLIAAVLWPRVAQSDPLGDLTYCDLCDSVGGLHGH
jgi:hypothetical protein